MDGSDSVNWFIGTAIVAALAWLLGVWLGRRSPGGGRCAIVLGLVLTLAWGWLMRHPAAAVLVIPVGVLSRIEGVGGVPFFMLILGVAWARSELSRQRGLIGWAMMFGAIYFVNGGLWMLQTTPAAVMGQTSDPYDIRQSEDYSCVPAACATALNLMGIPSTEREMAGLTQTRAGTGATVIRALDGLERRLAGTSLRPVLLGPAVQDLGRLPLPLLTPLQFETTRWHMVVISRVEADGVWIMDPMIGYDYFTFDELRAVYHRQVIAFEQTAD